MYMFKTILNRLNKQIHYRGNRLCPTLWLHADAVIICKCPLLFLNFACKQVLSLLHVVFKDLCFLTKINMNMNSYSDNATRFFA